MCVLVGGTMSASKMCRGIMTLSNGKIHHHKGKRNGNRNFRCHQLQIAQSHFSCRHISFFTLMDRRSTQTHRHTSTRAMSLAKQNKTPPPQPPTTATTAAITENNCNRCGTVATTIVRSATTGHFWFGSFLFCCWQNA